ncbi:MAG: hypothetical protein KJO38_06345, partial [Gammaproteobacteria bacterium]|nr:hypothetical protein [Gammaproteobacteria bacterium]
PAVADVDKLPETALKLSLRGVLHDVDADNTVAIINVRGHDKAYRLNDEVPGNARITEITPLLIVLERDGKLERLSLKLPSTENDKNTAPASAGRSRGPKPGGKRNEIALKAARAG